VPKSQRRTVGLRELKNRLSVYVRLVRDGESVLVTDRQQVVAELVPPGSRGDRDVHAGLKALERRGLLTPGATNSPDLYEKRPRSRKPGRAKRLLDAVRGDR